MNKEGRTGQKFSKRTKSRVERERKEGGRDRLSPIQGEGGEKDDRTGSAGKKGKKNVCGTPKSHKKKSAKNAKKVGTLWIRTTKGEERKRRDEPHDIAL